MARIPVTQTSQLQASPTGLPYHTHSIFKLRRLLIIIATIGFILCLFAGDPWSTPTFYPNILFLAVSIFFALCDLTQYALQKAHDPDRDPEWPRTIFMVGDVCLAVVLQLSFWFAIAALTWASPYGGAQIWAAYAALTAFLCSILHAYSFWKELMARCEKKWLLRLTLGPCPRCGYHEEETMTSEPEQQPQPPNPFPYAGPSATFHQATAHTPTSQDCAMEEGLLIGSESSRNYGAVGNSEPTIGQRDEVVVGKGKKKRVVEGKGEIL